MRLRFRHKEDSSPRVLSNAVTYAIGTMLQRGLAFLLLPFLTRILGVSNYGSVGVALAIAGVLSILFDLGMSTSIVRLYFDDDGRKPESVWGALVRLQILIALTLGSMTWILGPYWGTLFKTLDWGPVLKWAVAYSFALSVQRTSQSVLRAAQRAEAFLICSLISSLVGGLLGVGLAARAGPSGYLAGLTSGSIIGSLISLALTYRKPLWRRRAILSGVVLGLPFAFHQLSTWVIDLSDRVLIERFLGIDQVGIYQVGYVLATFATLTLASLNSAWAPFYYGLREVAKEELPKRLLVPVVIVFASLSGLLVILAPVVLLILAPPEFGDPMIVVALIAASTPIKAAFMLAFHILFDAKDSRSIAVSTVAAASANIGLNIILIPRFGINAAALSTIVSFGLQSLFMLTKAGQLLRTSLQLSVVVTIWGSSVLIFVGLAKLPTTSFGWIVRIFVALALSSAGYAAARKAASIYVINRGPTR